MIISCNRILQRYNIWKFSPLTSGYESCFTLSFNKIWTKFAGTIFYLVNWPIKFYDQNLIEKNQNCAACELSLPVPRSQLFRYNCTAALFSCSALPIFFLGSLGVCYAAYLVFKCYCLPYNGPFLKTTFSWEFDSKFDKLYIFRKVNILHFLKCNY